MSDKLNAKTENVQKLLDNCLKKQKQELISEFLDSWDNLRDFVLDAPILSDDVYLLRDYIHKIKDYIKLEREELEKLK